MSSGLDVFLEKLGGSLPEFPVIKKTYDLQENIIDTSRVVTYYLRVNGEKITWGHMKQTDDNLIIKYNKDNKTFTVEFI